MSMFDSDKVKLNPDLFYEQDNGHYKLKPPSINSFNKKKVDYDTHGIYVHRKACEYLQYHINRDAKTSTISFHMQNIRLYFGWIAKLKPHLLEEPFVLSRTVTLEFVEMLFKYGYTPYGVQLIIKTLKSMFKYIHNVYGEETFIYNVQVAQLSPVLARQAKDALKIFIPPVHEILALRKTRGNKLKTALLFELLLSTGFRINEISQLRAKDVNLDVSVIDIETQLPSIYFLGSISTMSQKIVVKNEFSRRTVYMSVLANELLRKWYRFNNIDPGSEMKVFTQPIIYRPLKEINSTFYFDMLKKYNPKGFEISIYNESINSSDYIKTVKSDAIEVDDGRVSIDKALDRARLASKDTIKDITLTRAITSGIWPHFMRHVASVIYYYRSQNGSRMNIQALKSFLGHAPSSKELEETYMKDYNYIHSDSEWIKIFKPTLVDWIDCRRR